MFPNHKDQIKSFKNGQQFNNIKIYALLALVYGDNASKLPKNIGNLSLINDSV